MVRGNRGNDTAPVTSLSRGLSNVARQTDEVVLWMRAALATTTQPSWGRWERGAVAPRGPARAEGQAARSKA